MKKINRIVVATQWKCVLHLLCTFFRNTNILLKNQRRETLRNVCKDFKLLKDASLQVRWSWRSLYPIVKPHLVLLTARNINTEFTVTQVLFCNRKCFKYLSLHSQYLIRDEKSN